MVHYSKFKKIKESWPLRPLLFILSLCYGFIITMRNFLYDHSFIKIQKLPGFTLSVGNITAGGSGKSPFILFLSQELQKNNFKIVILTRGYNSELNKNDIVLLEKNSSFFLKGEKKKFYADEAKMYAHKNPEVSVLVSPYRFNAAKEYLKIRKAPDLWIIDDGFQHRKISRNLDLVLFDSSLAFEAEVLPFGYLRENLKNLNRAHDILLTHTEKKKTKDFLSKLHPYLKHQGILKSSFSNTWPENPVTKEKLPTNIRLIAAICAIAQPDNFFLSLEKMGLKLSYKKAFSDHKKFSKKDKEKFQDFKVLITTEKDYYRDPNFFHSMKKQVYISQITLHLEDKKWIQNLTKNLLEKKLSKEEMN